MYKALVHWTCSWTLLLAGLKNLGQTGYGDVEHVGKGASRCIFCDIHHDYEAQMCSATHLHAMCTVFTRQRSAVRHTSLRSAQYLQRGGLPWDTPPRDLHVTTNVFKHPIYFGGALCDTPPRDLHSFYKCFCASGMFSFNFGGAFFAHLRAICTVFTTTYAFRRCARLGTL